MTNKFSISTPIDNDFLELVENECEKIIWQQRIKYNKRWLEMFFFKKTRSILRLTGLVVSILGAALCVFYLFYAGVCQRSYYIGLALLFFILVGILFYYLPTFDAKLKTRHINSGKKNSKKVAARMVKAAKKLTPFTAEYEIRGDWITYYRQKDDDWQLVWSRRLKGYVFTGEHATLFFRKPTSIMPTVLLMHNHNEIVKSVFDELTISYQSANTP